MPWTCNKWRLDTYYLLHVQKSTCVLCTCYVPWVLQNESITHAGKRKEKGKGYDLTLPRGHSFAFNTICLCTSSCIIGVNEYHSKLWSHIKHHFIPPNRSKIQNAIAELTLQVEVWWVRYLYPGPCNMCRIISINILQCQLMRIDNIIKPLSCRVGVEWDSIRHSRIFYSKKCGELLSFFPSKNMFHNNYN